MSYPKYIKRILDLLFAVLALVILSPLLVLTALAVRIDSRGPIIFRQSRLGKDGKPFVLYKFRSMRMGTEHTGTGQYSYAADPRVTRVGRVIRATSMDELPQLFNIIKGEMSFIGFRPVLTYHPFPYASYTPEQKQMFAQRPGITGWAQIHGRKCVNWDDRIAMNIWYAQHISFRLDLKIFFITIYKVISNADNVNTDVTVKTDAKIKQPTNAMIQTDQTEESERK